MFTDAEIDYLTTQGLGRLATQQPNGTLQVSPVGFTYNTDEKAIDVHGHRLAHSRKFRNIADNGKVAFVVDDRPSLNPMRVRCLEIRGHAEALTDGPDAVIRIHPERIISFGIEDPDHSPLELVPHNRNV
ncbi:PPOX class F420-dependent oxidoreductase [Amycolatopsis sp. GM8]|uniref:PPOX class F420-dependent oxidoreductase n=1 Tax=Amycolatopsis sp. GM8 TaxID=2896530 RepID=UPI001EFFDCA2|nr:PPOX class F420-dependent oxidoreductase [Amycolatopsis sp. GM8]